MTVRATSLAAFYELLASGELTRLERRILQAVHDLPTLRCTRRQIAQYLDDQASTVSGAVNRLIKRGIIPAPAYDIPCPVTGRLSEAIVL